jgi:hypothetical protein
VEHKLDCEVAFGAEEVDDVSAYAVLAAKPLAQELPTLKMTPEQGFGSCWVIA